MDPSPPPSGYSGVATTAGSISASYSDSTAIFLTKFAVKYDTAGVDTILVLPKLMYGASLTTGPVTVSPTGNSAADANLYWGDFGAYVIGGHVNNY